MKWHHNLAHKSPDRTVEAGDVLPAGRIFPRKFSAVDSKTLDRVLSSTLTLNEFLRTLERVPLWKWFYNLGSGGVAHLTGNGG
jgi:hypothetical protein